MVRLTFAKFALLGAGVATVAGVGAAGATRLGASSPVASQLAAGTSTPTPSAAPAKKHAGTALELHHRLVQATATATGQTVKQVRDELASGKTLNQIAGDKAAAVEKSVGDAARDRISKAVEMGTLSKEKAAKILSRLQSELDKLMASTHTKAAASAPSPKA